MIDEFADAAHVQGRTQRTDGPLRVTSLQGGNEMLSLLSNTDVNL